MGPPIGTNNHEVRDLSPAPYLKNYRMAEEESRDIIPFLKKLFYNLNSVTPIIITYLNQFPSNGDHYVTNSKEMRALC